MRFLLLTTLLACAVLAALPPSAAADSGWSWPVQGDVITPYRNGSDPYAAGQHRGIDIAAEHRARVSAAVAGTVTFAGTSGTSGLTVTVRTEDGRFDTSYLHLASAEVREEQRVAAGDRIGAVGTSGRRSAQRPHLHFGVRGAGSRHGYVDPLGLLPPASPPTAPEPPPVPVPIATLPFLEHVVAPAPASATVAVPGPIPGPAPAPLPAPEASPGGQPRGHLLGELPQRAPQAPRRAGHGAHEDASRDARARGVSRGPHAGRAPADGRALHDGRASPDGRGASGAHRRPGTLPAREAAPPAPTPAPTPRDPVTAKRASPKSGGRGLDLGWLAACLGLVAAALALGRPTGPVAAAREGRKAIAALTRPLTGRG